MLLVTSELQTLKDCLHCLVVLFGEIPSDMEAQAV